MIHPKIKIPKWLAITWLFALAAGVYAIFWYNDWVYNLPTPVPQNYVSVNTGTFIDLKEKELNINTGKPLFIHFFNPDCPCSRFNIPHFQSLVKKYGKQVNFAVVIMNNKNYSAEQICKKFDLNIPVLFDTTIAARCGVYSTPQAVIIGANHRLFYRGNYNRSRYCTDGKTNYAQIALDSLLTNNTSITFNRYATIAYGCQLPKCTK